MALPKITDPRLAALAEQALMQIGDPQIGVAPRQRRTVSEPRQPLKEPPRTVPCPVGWCLPDLGRPVLVHRRGQLCERHTRMLRPSMAIVLERAQAGGAELAEAIRVAVLEARASDRHWSPAGVLWSEVRGRCWVKDQRGTVTHIERYAAREDAIRRAGHLYDTWAVQVLGEDGIGIAAERALAECEHEIEQADHAVIARGATLYIALGRARDQGYPAYACNLVTDQRMPIAEVRELLRRAYS